MHCCKFTPLADLFWPRVDKSGGPDACWPWNGPRSRDYGHVAVRVDGRWTTTGAHRIAYELLVGPIPAGLFLDHLCRNPPCVNPAHLEPVTNGENTLRGIGPSAQNARRTTCRLGHELVPDYGTSTRRHCLTCHRERQRLRMARVRAKARAAA